MHLTNIPVYNLCMGVTQGDCLLHQSTLVAITSISTSSRPAAIPSPPSTSCPSLALSTWSAAALAFFPPQAYESNYLFSLHKPFLPQLFNTVPCARNYEIKTIILEAYTILHSHQARVGLNFGQRSKSACSSLSLGLGFSLFIFLEKDQHVMFGQLRSYGKSYWSRSDLWQV